MNKPIILLVLFIFIFGIFINKGYANKDGKPRPLEEVFSEIGYTTAEEAVKGFENHFNKDVKLPVTIPSISFTHYFGRFTDLEGEVNDSLGVTFISEKSPENHYKIDIRPIEHKIQTRDKDIKKVYTLKTGEDAKYFSLPGFNVLVFEKSDWQYMLSIDKRAKGITVEYLLRIADTIE